jgi:hypothetical protein
MSTPDPTPTSLPAAPDWRAFCAAVLDDIDTGTAVDIDAVADRLRAALATPPAVDGDERLRLVTAGVCSGYIAGHDATVEGHYGDPDEVAAEMAPMVLAEVGATPPAATREAGPLPQAPTDEDLDDLCAEFSFLTDDEESRDLLIEMFRAVLARWGGAAVEVQP